MDSRSQTEFFSSSSLRLEPHPVARSKAVSQNWTPAGSVLISVSSLSTILLASTRGLRCDFCHSLPSGKHPLRKCSGCGSYWYCDAECQTQQWKAHHRRICKLYNQFTSSTQYQALAPHERADSLLLSQMVAEHGSNMTSTGRPYESPLSIFLSLIPCPAYELLAPPICLEGNTIPKESLDDLYTRFGNNNFAIHSHLTTFASGIFPLASRLFNHSCLPNAAARYIITPSRPIKMEVIALRDISVGEEICLPYLDPALCQSRQQVFELTYGFHCNCSSCSFIASLGKIPSLPTDAVRRAEVDQQLRAFIFPPPVHESSTLPKRMLNEEDKIPDSLYCVFNESYLTSLSETFSKASHERAYDVALESGLTLLAFYALIYPPNYPQIGMHTLELAKTAWNAIVTGTIGKDEDDIHLERVRRYLAMSQDILNIFGFEGDRGGPLEEVKILQELVNP